MDPGIGPIGPATDVYALGLMTFEMITGQKPAVEAAPKNRINPIAPTHTRSCGKGNPESAAQEYPLSDTRVQERFCKTSLLLWSNSILHPLTHRSSRVPTWWPQRTADSAPEPGDPPFMGMQHFNVEDADRFFGREALTTHLLRLLIHSPTNQQVLSASLKPESYNGFLAIVGASGSGKSSLVRAGLVATLKQGKMIPGSDKWDVYLLTPSAHPVKALAQSVTRHSTSDMDTVTLMDDLSHDPRSLRFYLRRESARNVTSYTTNPIGY